MTLMRSGDAAAAALRDLGVHLRDGEWIVARPADVTAALTSPTLGVPPVDPAAGDALQLQARWARFSDGAHHARARAVAEQLLPTAAGLHEAAARRTTALLSRKTDAFDVMPLAKTVPVETLAAALGLSSYVHRAVATLVGRLCDALAPTLGPPTEQSGDGDIVARELAAILAGIGPWTGEQLAAVSGLLFQARDATAALIGTALLDDRAAGRDPAASVERALRRDAPVQRTRRVAVERTEIGGSTVPPGAAVWVVLAAAEEGPPAKPSTFGAGPHRCPGATHATALATGVVAALRTAGWHAVSAQDVAYEPRPNLRMPASVLLDRQP